MGIDEVISKAFIYAKSQLSNWKTIDSPVKNIRTFDIDGVILINKKIGGLRPELDDIIITGRSYEEQPETDRALMARGINNKVYFNPLKFDEKSRESSGYHKARTIKLLQSAGYTVMAHHEDDEIQATIIRKECPGVELIMIVHNLTEKENVRHLEF